MKLSDYLSDPERRDKLAADLGTSADYLYQIATGRRRGRAEFVAGIVRGTGGVVTLPEVWPDLSDAVAPNTPRKYRRKRA